MDTLLQLRPRMNGQFIISSQIPDNLLSNRLTLDAMKFLRHTITIVCLVATFIANAGEQLTPKPSALSINQPMQNCTFSREHGREPQWAMSRTTKSPSRSPAIHSIFTGTRTSGLIRQL